MATRLAVAPAVERGKRHALGQHFLRAPRIIETIVQAADIQPGDQIWEIGCGDGALTDPLWQKGLGLTLLELDPTLVAAAHAQWPAMSLWQGDAAQVVPRLATELAAEQLPSVVVSNLPYSAATAVLRAFFLPAYIRTRLVFMFQREVAQRIVGRQPGDRGPLYGMAALLYDVRSVVRVPPGAFNPPPKVDSEVLSFTPRQDPQALQVRHEVAPYWTFLTRAFGSRRKTLRNNLAELRALPELADLAAVRPETLSAQQLWDLYLRLRARRA